MISFLRLLCPLQTLLILLLHPDVKQLNLVFSLFIWAESRIVLPKHKQRVSLDKEEIIKKLENLEKKEEEVSSEGEEEKKDEEEEKEEYDKKKHEEETDYIMSHFDNGEDFGGDSDDNVDEATC